MMIKKREIKSIDNIAARKVAFSKRRKCLFKKACELSTLCDADIGLIVFSDTGRLFEYANSSMQQVFERHILHSNKDLFKLDHPNADGLQLENCPNAMLKKEVADRTLELRRLNGEELEGLKAKDLKKLEELLNRCLNHVHKVKVDRILDGINVLKNKEEKLTEENQQLKQILTLEHAEPGQPSDDTSLRLGLPFPDGNGSF